MVITNVNQVVYRGDGVTTAFPFTFRIIDATDIKLLLNVEYRPRLFGNLYGAVFVDAGNVWSMREDDNRPGAKFKACNVPKEMALGTGVGFRYDLDFFVIRVDWGVGIHTPSSAKKGFYNMGKFSDSHSLHLAVGYPF